MSDQFRFDGFFDNLQPVMPNQEEEDEKKKKQVPITQGSAFDFSAEDFKSTAESNNEFVFDGFKEMVKAVPVEQPAPQLVQQPEIQAPPVQELNTQQQPSLEPAPAIAQQVQGVSEPRPVYDDKDEIIESIPYFAGKERSENIGKNAFLDLKEQGEGLLQLWDALTEDPVQTAKMIAENFDEALIGPYQAYYDAYKKGVLLETIQRHPVDFAQTALLPITFAASTGATVAKAVSSSAKVAKAAKTIERVSNVAMVASDPLTGIPGVAASKTIGAVAKKLSGGKTDSIIEAVSKGKKMSPAEQKIVTTEVADALGQVDRVKQPQASMDLNAFEGVGDTSAIKSVDPAASSLMVNKPQVQKVAGEFSNVGKKQKLKAKAPASINPDVETVRKASRGISQKNFVTKAKEAFNDLPKLSRHFPELDPKKDALVADILRQQEAVPNYSKVLGANALRNITDELDAGSFDLFERYIIAKDVTSDALKGSTGPSKAMGYSGLGDLATDMENYTRAVMDNPHVMKAVEKRNRFMNALRNDLVNEGLLPATVLNDDTYFHHQVLQKIAEKDINGIGVQSPDVRNKTKGFQKGRTGSEKAFNQNYLESEFEVISQAISQLETKRTLQKVKEASDISDTVKRIRAENPDAPIPAGYALWQPKEGNNFFKAQSLSEGVADEIIKKQRDLLPEDLKDVLAIGGKREEWVIPEGLAKTLDNFKDNTPEGISGAIDRFSKDSMNKWKQWTLLNPFSFVKYNLNNMSGDMDIVMAYNPKILGKTGRAWKELRALSKGGNTTPDIDEALRKGVIDSGFSASEVPDINADFLLKDLDPKSSTLKKLSSRVLDAPKAITNARENLLRYASYLHFKEELAQGKRLYGASKKVEIDQIFDNTDKAAKLSRELVGDYGNLSTAGQWMRSHVMPFYSWLEINAPRYVRLLKNTANEVRGSNLDVGLETAWRATKRTTAQGVKFAAGAGAMYGLINLYNRTMFPEETREMEKARRGQTHLILGRNEEGGIRSIRFQGALSDALSWASLDDAPSDVEDLYKGDKTAIDMAKDAGKATVNKIVLGSLPITKTLGEIATETQLYPDVFNPRPLRDPAGQVAGVLSVKPIYSLVTGKPTRGLNKTAEQLLFYNTDADEAAYWLMKNKEFDYMDKIDPKEQRGMSMYFYKQAVRYGDDQAAKKYLGQYFELGGTLQGFQQSLLAGAPMSGVKKMNRQDFLNSLNEDEKKMMKQSMKWYSETIKKSLKPFAGPVIQTGGQSSP
jgi:hypothetical protein